MRLASHAPAPGAKTVAGRALSRASGAGGRRVAAISRASGAGSGRVAAILVTAGLLATACAAAPAVAEPSRTHVIRVVASENFWGSIARELGGSHVSVYSIISDPNADPHEFEGSATSARAVALANLVIENGAGYDDWVSQLLSASPSPHRRVLDIAAMLGKRPGDNPHLWYGPGYVTATENRMEALFKALDPADSAYFSARRAATGAAFARVRAQLASIRRSAAGTPVAATESVVAYLARYLGLKLISPPAFMRAVSEGNEPPAASVAVFAHQLATHQPAVLIYNEQTATALTTSMRELAMRYHIPVAGVTETIQPPGRGFPGWFGAELASLAGALKAGVHR